MFLGKKLFYAYSNSIIVCLLVTSNINKPSIQCRTLCHSYCAKCMRQECVEGKKACVNANTNGLLVSKCIKVQQFGASTLSLFIKIRTEYFQACVLICSIWCVMVLCIIKAHCFHSALPVWFSQLCKYSICSFHWCLIYESKKKKQDGFCTHFKLCYMYAITVSSRGD